MHSTRIAAFLLGAWLTCCLFLDAVVVQNFRFASRFLATPAPQVSAIVKAAGQQQVALMLRHFVAEQSRFYFSTWGLMQLPLAALALVLIYFAMEKRTLPAAVVGVMLLLVAFQTFFITPELSFRGREVDFPPMSGSLAAQARLWMLAEVFIATEAAKVIIGMVLAAYVFAYKSRLRVRSANRAPEVERALSRGAAV
jgi:hypothetical protein